MAKDVHRITHMSGLQSQAIPPARVAPRVPWYVYAAAILLLGWAFVLLIAWLSLERFDPLFWRAMVPVTWELAIARRDSSRPTPRTQSLLPGNEATTCVS